MTNIKNVHRMKKEEKERIAMRIDHTTDEEKLLQIIQQHGEYEAQAYEELYSRYSKLIKYIANQSLGNEADAEDIVQETFVEIQRSMDSLRNLKYFRLWVYRIVHSKCSNAFRKKKFSYADVDGEYIQTRIPEERKENVPQKQMRFQSDQEMMQAFLSEIPSGQALVLQMYYMEQFSIKEISEALKLPEGTVKSRMYAGKKALKDKVEMYEKTNDTKVSFHSIDEALLLSFAGVGISSTIPKMKVSNMNFTNIGGLLTSKMAVVALCGVCVAGGGSAIYQSYQNNQNNEMTIPANAQKLSNNFRKVIVDEKEIVTAKAAYFYLLERACCKEEIKAMKREEIQRLEPVYASLKESQGYHYQLLNSNGWIFEFEEKLK